MNKGNFARFALALALALAFAGCGEKTTCSRPKVKTWTPTMENPAPVQYGHLVHDKTLEQMSDDDVIVAVNGVALTRGELLLALKRYWWTLNLNKMDRKTQKGQKYRLYGRSYPDAFVNTQLLCMEARRLKVLTKGQVSARVDKTVRELAAGYRVTQKTLGAQIPGGLEELKRSMEEMVWSNEYVRRHVKPEVEVDDTMVSNALAQVEAENEQIAVTNALRRKMVVDALDKVRKGADFGKTVDEFGAEDDVAKGNDGEWKSFRTDLEKGPPFTDKIFPLKKGQLSDVIEDEEGYYFVKVMDIKLINPSTNAAEAVTNRIYRYDLGRFFQPKEEPVTLAASNLKQDFRRQLMDEATDKRVGELRKTALIVYPNGTNFWGKMLKKGPVRTQKLARGKAARKVLKEAKAVKKAVQDRKNPYKVLDQMEQKEKSKKSQAEKPKAKKAKKASAGKKEVTK